VITAFRPRHRPWRWLALWSVLLALVAAGSLMPAQSLPTPPVPGLDKLEHLVGHGLLSAYAAMLFAPARLRIAAVVSLFGFGLGIEGAQQAFTTSRMADAGDVLANAIGVALGQLVAITPMAGWLAAIDARLHA
jgi:VanZ family protein